MKESHKPAAKLTQSTTESTVLQGATEVIGITHQRDCGDCQHGCKHPYSYAAHANSHQQSPDSQLCFLSDSLFGLLNYLQRKNIALTEMHFISLAHPCHTPVNARLYGIIEGRWSN